jgi:putative hydrolase of the HAD superfamily
MKKKAVLWDIDGVFVQHTERFSDAYIAKFKIDKSVMDDFFDGEFQECLVGEKDLRRVLPKYFESWKWKGNISSLLYFWFSLPAVLNPHVVQFNKEIKEKGFKTYAATNQEAYRAAYIKDTLKLGEQFEEFFSSAMIGYKKPDKKFFEEILKQINLRPDEIIFVDDDEVNIKGAETVGIDSILYRGHEEFLDRINELIK